MRIGKVAEGAGVSVRALRYYEEQGLVIADRSPSGASKALVLSFTQALWAETKDTGVRVVVVSPGAVETPMNPTPAPGQRKPAQVADTVMAALRSSRRPSLVDGRPFTVQAFVFSRLLPVRATARIAGHFFLKKAQNR